MFRALVIWVSAIALSLVAGITAIGSVSKKKAPQLAVMLQPVNGFALDTMSRVQLVNEIGKSNGKFPVSISSQEQSLAQRAFKSEPFSISAIVALAVGASTASNRDSLMTKASVLTRRDSMLSAWMIADAAEKNDLAKLLKYYDVTMRTNGASQSILLPEIAKLVANDRFIPPLATALERNPNWADAFWRTLVGTKSSLKNAVLLRRALTGPAATTARNSDVDLIAALVTNYHFDTAYQLYRQLNKDAKIGVDVFSSGSGGSGPYAPIDWQLNSNGQYGAQIVNGKLEISATANSGGEFAKRLMEISPGRYDVVTGIENFNDQDALLNMHISCAETKQNGAKEWKMKLGSGMNRQDFVAPANLCTYYWVKLKGASGTTDLDAVINKIELVSASSASN
ncbi:hypothetical protein ACFOWX_08690 [Sphingorhabdus arenilitoris]|uniref:Uncharacterized protein n=1 Tax=Sphingorhabdus arenilitoris TaxID=1490041 RepID=A0ABV8RIB5_9SPHN